MKLSTLAATLAVMVTTAPGWAAEFEWTLGSQVGPSDPATVMLEEFAERVGERTDGRMEIEVVPLESVGLTYEDALRAAQQGVVDAVHIHPYYMARDEPRLMAFMPHTVLLDREDNLKIADLQYEIAEGIYRDWDLVPFARTTLGGGSATQNIVCTEPVNTLDELRQVKLRHFDKIGIDAMNALGVATQPCPHRRYISPLERASLNAPSTPRSIRNLSRSMRLRPIGAISAMPRSPRRLLSPPEKRGGKHYLKT